MQHAMLSLILLSQQLAAAAAGSDPDPKVPDLHANQAKINEPTKFPQSMKKSNS